MMSGGESDVVELAWRAAPKELTTTTQGRGADDSVGGSDSRRKKT